MNITRQMSLNAIIAAGMTLVILTGGIDLSVGSILAFVGIVTALALKAGMPVLLAAPFGLLLGAALGGVNGGLIAFGRLPPFVVTLAMMAVARSLTRVVTDNKIDLQLTRRLELADRHAGVCAARAARADSVFAYRLGLRLRLRAAHALPARALHLRARR